MKDVVHATCPGCRRTLNIPAEWADKTMRCKHCGHAVQGRRVAAVPAARPAMATGLPAPTFEVLPDDPPARGTHRPAPTVAPEPAPVQNGYISAYGTSSRFSGRGRYSGPKNRAWLKYAILTVFFLAVAGGIAATAVYRPDVFRRGGGGDEQLVDPAASALKPPVDQTTGAFPRRMLAISIHSYLYANPLHNGDSGLADEAKRTGTDAAIRRLAERWRIPKDQVYHLTDAPALGDKRPDPIRELPKLEPKKEPPKPPKKELAKKEMPKGIGKEMAKRDPLPPPRSAMKNPPLKSVVEGAITQFLENSRAQDRVVLVFCGHAIEKAGVVYLVPLEGDFEEIESLIPLSWLHEKLAACPAQEKLVVYDVCRFHPDRGVERPHGGPMSPALETALHAAPEGVSVLTSCSANEQAYELDYALFNRRYQVSGSFFLSFLIAGSLEGGLVPEGKFPSTADNLPVERLEKYESEKIPDAVKTLIPGKTQTPKLTLRRNAETVAYDPAEPAPARFEFPAPPPSVDPRSVLAILKEIQLPPIKAFRKDAPPTAISDVLPFKEEDLKDYLAGALKPSDEPTPFQKVVLTAVDEIRKLQDAAGGRALREEFGGESNDAAKNELKNIQAVPAMVEAILTEQHDELEKVAPMRDAQPKRWQVNFDYVLAQVKFRICYVNQYNLALANVRSGKLPDLSKDQNGYRLTAETTLAKNTGPDYKLKFEEAKKVLSDIVKNHPHTPWALLAKSDRTVAIGLKLTPTALGTR